MRLARSLLSGANLDQFCGWLGLSRLTARARSLGAAASILLSLVCRAGFSAAPVELPAECGTAADFERELHARSVDPGLLEQAQVLVERDSSGYRLRMLVRGEAREFRDADCSALMRAGVVVVIALSEASQRSESPRAATEAEYQVRTGATATTAATPVSANSEHAGGARFFAGIGAGMNAGLLPRPAVVLELETGVAGPHWGVVADFRLFPQSATRDSTGHGVSLHALGGQLAATFRPLDTLQLQMGGGAYRLSGSGLGSVLPLTDSAWAIALTSGAAIVPLRRNGFEFGFGAEGAVYVQRPGFEIRGYREVFRSSLIGGSVFFRLAQSFQ